MAKAYTSSNTRLMKNTILLYFRMILMMCINLYTSRIVLQTLGVEDYGIYDVVGGVVILFSFINDGMTTSTLRFLTIELGTGNKKKLHEVFVASLQVHLLISLLIVLLSESVGLWFLLERMVIPANRMQAALFCYQLSIFTAVVNIMSYPYNAAIIAHERMAAFAYISIIDAVLKLLLVYLLLVFDYDRLILYALLYAAEKLLIRSFYNLYCTRHFDECHYQWIYRKKVLQEMLAFAGWNVWGNLSYILSSQGLNMVLNVFFGPIANAARAVSVQVQGAVSQLAGNFQMAINPQITKTYACGQLQETHQLIFRSSRFTFCLLLILCLPIIVETPAILGIWLKNVPDNSVAFIRLLLIVQMVQQNANPLSTALAATGKIRKCEFINGMLMLSIVPIAFVVLEMGGASWSVFAVHLCVVVICFIVRLHIVLPMIGLRFKDYFQFAMKRCILVLFLSLTVPYALKQTSCQSLYFSILTIILTIMSTCLLSYAYGLDTEEKKLVLGTIRAKFQIGNN